MSKPIFFLISLLLWENAFVSLPNANGNVDRPIVIEEFTGVWCTYCYGASISLDRLEAENPRTQIIGIVYHIDDEYTIPFCYERTVYYQNKGYPSAWFNGRVQDSGGASVKEGPSAILTVYKRYREIIQSERERIASQSVIELQLRGDLNPASIALNLTITNQDSYAGAAKAIFLITEDKIPVRAPNGQVVINSLVRAHLGTIPVDLSQPGTVQLNAALTEEMTYLDEKNLQPVVFLQDEDSREILAAIGEFTGTVVQSWELY